MYVIKNNTNSEHDLSIDKPELKSGFSYYYANTGTITFSDITSWSVDASDTTLTINGTGYSLSSTSTHPLTIDTTEIAKNSGTANITLTKNDDLELTPLLNPELASFDVTLSAGSHGFSFDTAGTFRIRSQNYISNTIFIKVTETSMTPRGTYLTVT